MTGAPYNRPPGASLRRVEGVGIFLLLGASLALLPFLYELVRAETGVVAVLLVSLLSMGLGWSAGFFLEKKRTGLARMLAATGILAAAAAMLPAVQDISARWLLVACGALSGLALALLRRR